MSDSTPPKLVAGYQCVRISAYARRRDIALTMKYFSACGSCAAYTSFVICYHVDTSMAETIDAITLLTKMAKVGFHPPSSCVFGSKPRASLPCKLECHTFSITPAGIPS